MDSPISQPNPTDVNIQSLQPEDIHSEIQSLPAVVEQPILDREERAKHRAESSPRFLKTRQFAGRAVMAAVCTIPVADLALSDAATFKVLQESQKIVHVDSPAKERLIEDGIVSLTVGLESILLGAAITRSRKLKGAFADMEEYTEERYSKMSRPRKALSQIANAPYTALGYISEKFEKLGEKLAARKTRAARVLGTLVVDTGKVNAIGTSSVILQETLAGNPPSLKRNAYLAALIATTWVGTAEGVREIYRGVPILRPPMDAIASTFETLTTPDNPASIALLGSIALGLANSGWNIAKFHEQKTQRDKAATNIIEG